MMPTPRKSPSHPPASTPQQLEVGRSLDRLFHEINLLRLEGYYFCLDPKAAAKRTGRQEFLQPLTTSEGRVEKALAIEPDARYGYPSALAYKVLLAIAKKLSDYGYPVQDSVSFSQRELAALTGRKTFGGKDAKEFSRAIMQLKNTDIWGSFYDKDTEEWQVISFSILTSVIFSGRRQQVRECVVYLAPQIVQSLNSRYAFCLNYQRLEGLEPIGIALFKHLFFRFSYLHSTRKFASKTYTKDYSSICEHWLGGLKVLRYKSKIVQEQLGRHLQALKDVKLIRSFRIEKNSRGDGFNIVFTAGSGFFDDYRDFYTRMLQPGLPFDRALDENTVQKPLEIVRHFYKRRYGTTDVDEIMVSTKESDFARELLETYSYRECEEIVAYALREAEQTGFNLQNFGGVRLYLAAFTGGKERRQRQQEVLAEQRAAAEEDRLQEQYQAFRRSELQSIRNTMPADELTSIEAPIKGQLQEKQGSPVGIDILVRLQVNKVLEERYSIPSFDEWRARFPADK